MTTDEIMALADRYATRRQHAHYNSEVEARQALREAIDKLVAENEAKDALLRQALEALEYYRSGEDCHPTLTSEAIDALKERLK